MWRRGAPIAGTERARSVDTAVGQRATARRTDHAGAMSTVAVTGSSGKLGRHVVAHLADHGHRVIALDRHRDPRSPAAAFVRVDLTDTGQVLEALTGVDDVHDGLDAVVHLAAIPAPGLTTNGATFANNIAATHNVFAAARRAGIRNVVWASSETVLGLPFGTAAAVPPRRRGVPAPPNSTYSLVKTLEEEMARQFCRWVPDLAMVGLRFSNVMDPTTTRGSPRSTPTRGRAAGTCGATSTAATGRRRCAARSSTARPATPASRSS